MATEITMPQMSDTMKSAKILQWYKKEGQPVKRGEMLAEVETDKANLEIEAFASGILVKILTAAGQVANVGETIGYIGAANESVGANSSTGPTPPSRVDTNANKPNLQIVSAAAPINSELPSNSLTDSERVKASPLAKRIARDLNLDISKVVGTGPSGRIIKRDVEAFKTNPASASPARRIVTETVPSTPSTPQSASTISTTGGRISEMSKMRQTIGERMQQSVTTQPHFYVSNSVNMGEALRLKEVLKEELEYKGLTVNHLVIKAVAYALQKEPRVNRSIRDSKIFEPDQINIGIVTAIEDGLLIPVVKDANRLALKDLIFEARAAVERARAGRPSANDLTGGTFSISNLGMYDVDSFTAIINPGQGGILAVSAIKEQAVVINGQLAIAQIMNVTVSVDHRIIDGVMAGIFLKYFKQALETPALLMT